MLKKTLARPVELQKILANGGRKDLARMVKTCAGNRHKKSHPEWLRLLVAGLHESFSSTSCGGGSTLHFPICTDDDVVAERADLVFKDLRSSEADLFLDSVSEAGVEYLAGRTDGALLMSAGMATSLPQCRNG